jgi:DNA-directed RNA polymerase specialized sigma24 family protein
MSHVHASTVAATVAAVPATIPSRERPMGLCEAIFAACDRDPDAAEIVAKALRPRLVAEIERALGETHGQDAEDVADEFFVAILDGGVTIAAGGSPVQRLMTAARNFARSHLHALRGNCDEED